MFWRIMHTTAHYVYFLSTMLTLYAVFFVVHFTRRSKQGDDMNAERILNKDKVTMVIQFAGNLMEMFVIIYMLLKFIVPYKLAYNIYCKDWGRIVLRFAPRFFLPSLSCTRYGKALSIGFGNL